MLPGFCTRFDHANPTGWFARRQAIFKVWLPAGAVFFFLVSGRATLSPQFVESVVSAISVFSALFFGALFPLLELRQRNKSGRSGSKRSKGFVLYIENIIVSIIYGLVFAFLAILFGILSVTKTPWHMPLLNTLVSATCLTAVWLFLHLLVATVKELIKAYSQEENSS